MKILYVTSALTKGGAEKVVVELANMASSKNNEVSILAGWPTDPEILQNQINNKVEVFFLSKNNRFSYFKIPIWIFKNLKKLTQYDIIHCHLSFGSFFGTLFYIFSGKLFKKKHPILIETYHAVGMNISKASRWSHSLLSKYRDGFVIMAKDAFWDNFLIKNKNIKSELILNGIALPNNLDNLLEKNKDKKPQTKYVVGTIGMLRPDRQPHLYIPIFKSIYQSLGDDVSFIIGGNGPEMENMKQLIDDNNLSKKIQLIGLVNNATEVLVNLDLYISLSVDSAAGISMIEAAMCKIPVVAIQLNKNYKRKDTDWIWSDADPSKVSTKTISLLQNENEQSSYQKNQYDYLISNLTSEVMYNKYEKLYKALLEKNSN